MSSFWSWYIIIIVAVNIIGCAWILWRMRHLPKDGTAKGAELDHDFDGIKELNNPLPSWWMWLFWITIVISVVYLFLYPGMGNYKGSLHWTQQGQYKQEVKQADATYGKIFAQYQTQSLPELAKNSKALALGKRLFINNCTTCHGADAKGARGYPNLTDGKWLWGNTPEAITTSITHGRTGMMPPMGAAIGGEEGIKQVVNYILELNGRKFDATLAAIGKKKFATVCAACHGADAKGNPMLGAPNLTDNNWLFGGSIKELSKTIRDGRHSHMPPQNEHLSAAKIHLLAAYVYSLSQQKQ